jgi:hypothetical protein
VAALLQQVQYCGTTPLAGSLVSKVLQPIVYRMADSGQLQKPVLIISITDGEPTDTPKDMVVQVRGQEGWEGGCLDWEAEAGGRCGSADEGARGGVCHRSSRSGPAYATSLIGMCWIHAAKPLPCCLLIVALVLLLQVIKDARQRLQAYGPKAVAFEFAQVGSCAQPLKYECLACSCML